MIYWWYWCITRRYRQWCLSLLSQYYRSAQHSYWARSRLLQRLSPCCQSFLPEHRTARIYLGWVVYLDVSSYYHVDHSFCVMSTYMFNFKRHFNIVYAGMINYLTLNMGTSNKARFHFNRQCQQWDNLYLLKLYRLSAGTMLSSFQGNHDDLTVFWFSLLIIYFMVMLCVSLFVVIQIFSHWSTSDVAVLFLVIHVFDSVGIYTTILTIF